MMTVRVRPKNYQPLKQFEKNLNTRVNSSTVDLILSKQLSKRVT